MASEAITSTPTAEYNEYTNSQRWTILIALMLGTLMQVVDSSIVNVAIPTMMGNLGATMSQISWVSTGYIIASVIILPLTGWLTLRFGRRHYLAASVALFTITSFFCGTSRSLNALIFFRVLQGAGGAALLSTAQATMMEIFPPQQLGMVQAIYGIGVMVGPTVGPTLGGWITDNYNWPWIFFINIPIGIVATILTMMYVHNSKFDKAKVKTGVDFVGIGLLAIGLGCLQTVLEKGNTEGWFDSGFICWMSLLAIVGLVAFVCWELYTPSPAVNLRVLRNRGFAAGTIFGTAIGVGLYGGMYILPVFIQQLRHYTAQQTGLIMLPGAIATTVAMPIVGKLVNRVQARTLVAIGAIGFIISCVLMHTITLLTGPEHLFWPLVLRGASMGFLFVPLSMATLIVLKPKDLAAGSGLYNLARQLGGSAGIAMLATIVDHRMAFHRANLVNYINEYNPLAAQRIATYQHAFQAKGMALEVARRQALASIDGIIQGQSAVQAYGDAFLIIGIIFLASLPLLILLKQRAIGDHPKPAAK